MDEEILQQLEQILEYDFSNRDLLVQAFTHSSSVEDRPLSNERLEFFGDSVLCLMICQILFERFPDYLEGDLTKIKSMLVSRKTCAKLSRQMHLQKYLKVGKGMSSSRALTGSLAAGLLEAVIGAIYIDGGFESARNFILKAFGSLIDSANAQHSQGNYKSMLQQYAQQKLDSTPTYELLDEKGPDHDKCFEAQAVIDDKHFKSAWGINKKEAEQKAAFNALVELGLVQNISDEVESD